MTEVTSYTRSTESPLPPPPPPTGYASRKDGGKVAYVVSGPASGYPVFFLHGTPGSRVGVLPRPFELARRRVRLIAIDRPGYGESDRRPGRDVASVAEDVAAVADDLEVEHFAVSGRSGGGPHALACGALLGDRVDSVVALVSIAPFDALGPEAWYRDMTPSNVKAYKLTHAALENPLLMPDLTKSLADDMGALATDFIAERLLGELPSADRVIVSDTRIRSLLLGGFRAAVDAEKNRVQVPDLPGVTYLAGRYDDHVAFCRPWGFDPADIQCPVLLWHGGTDVYSPPDHSRWLASRIPRAVLDLDPWEAHFGAVRYFPHLLSWMLKNARTS